MRMQIAISLSVFVVMIFCSFRPAISQGKVDPAARARLDREFAVAHPQPGDYLPTIELTNLYCSDGNTARSDLLRYSTPGDVKLVVTASLTCPKTRQHFPALQQLKKKYGERLGVVVVYVIEAHPEHDLCPYLGVVDVTEANLRDNIRFRQPTTMDDRTSLAKRFAKSYPFSGSVLVDSMDNIAWRTLGKSPNMALLADSEGRVVYSQGWVEPKSLVVEIEKLLVATKEILRSEGYGSSVTD